MPRNPKILLAAPTSMNKAYIFLDWYLYASNLTYPDYDIFIVDNSHDINYHKELKKTGINIEYVNPAGKRNVDYITESQNLIRDKFLKGKYDYLFSLEVDIFPPRNIIEKLLSDKKDIVGVPYFISYGAKSYLLIQQLADRIKEKYIQAAMPYDLSLEQSFAEYDGTVKEAYANGIGCTLIHRNIIEKLKFRTVKSLNLHSDTFFYLDIFQKLKIKNFIDTSAVLVHHNSDWGIVYDHAKNG